MIDPERYRALFVQEAREHLNELSDGLAALQDPPDRSVLDALFRAAHSFKGMAATLGFDQEADLAHAVEDHLDRGRSTGRLDGAIVHAMVRAIDHLSHAVDAVESDGPRVPLDTEATHLRSLLAPHAAQARPEDPDSEGAFAQAVTDLPADRCCIVSFRIDGRCIAPRARLLIVKRTLATFGTVHAVTPAETSWAHLLPGARVRMLVETTAPHEGITQRVGQVPDITDVGTGPTAPTEIRDAAGAPHTSAPDVPAHARQDPSAPVTDPSGPADRPDRTQARRDAPATRRTQAFTPGRILPRTVRVDLDEVERLLDQAAELRIAHSRLERLLDEFIVGRRPYPLTEAMERLTRETRSIHDAALSLRTLPVRFVTDRYPRLVRDLADRLGKEVRLEFEGADTQADRSVLEVVADPIAHLINNALDHGIETPDERRATGKPPTALLRIAFERTAIGMRVTVADDGRGIARDAALTKAVERGLVTTADAGGLSDEEVFRLLATPGFSTSDHVTEVSGRGVGLDAVKANLEKVGGSMRLTSRPGAGTTVVLDLPPTLAVVEALEVGVDLDPYYIPVDAILATTSLTQGDIGRGVVEIPEARLRSHDPHAAEDPPDADSQDPKEDTLPTEPVRIIDLGAILDLPPRRYAPPPPDTLEAMALGKGGRGGPDGTVARRRARDDDAPRDALRPLIGIVVERYGERACLVTDRVGTLKEIVVKSFDVRSARSRHVSGATIRGDGRVGLILDVPSVLLSAPRTGRPGDR